MIEQSIEPQLPQDLGEGDKTRALEQYRILAESLNNTNQVRETSNNFWMAVNGLGLTAIAYIKEAHTFPSQHKPFVLWLLTLVGIVLCFAWLNFLSTIKRTVEVRNNILIELERYLPVKIFTRTFEISQRQEGKSSLTFKEMLVPSVFLLGYIMFAIGLFWFTEELIIPSQ